VKNRALQLALLLSIGLLLALAGCGPSESAPGLSEGASTSGSLDENSAGSWVAFRVPVARPGDPIGVDLRGVVQSGILRVQILDASDHAIWQQETTGPGILAVNTVVKPPTAGETQLGLAWDGPVAASYSLAWAPGKVEVDQVTPIALIGGLGMIFVAAGFLVYAARHRLGWRYLGLGALAWILAIILKFVWALAFNQTVYTALLLALPTSLADPIFALYVGALTGLFEVLLLWLVMRFTKLGQMTWAHALAFGIGFGIVEALLLGIQSLLNALVAITAPAILPLGPDLVAQLNNPLYQLAPVFERFFSILMHTFACLLVIYAACTRHARWFWLAFAYKTGIDTVAAFAQVLGLVTFPTIWAIEAVVIVWGIAGWLGIRWLHKRWDDSELDTTSESPSKGGGAS
jgi:uncharacterized membrane protein YhfC